jgi:FAD/FMN-containing dehydrogenase
MGGSISAEHGIGLLRSQQLPAYKDATAMQLMHQIKLALDPQNLLYPSRVLARP